MRALVLLLPLLLAGCSSGGPASPSANTTNAPAAALPPPIHDTQMVEGSVDQPGVPPCSQPTTKCFHHPFELNGTVTINATLTWGLDRNDFDLYLYRDGAVTASGKGSSGTSEHVATVLGPGKYDLVVGGSTVAADTYKLDATFS